MKAIKLTYVLAAVLALAVIGTGCQKRPGLITPLKDPTTHIRPGDIGDVPPIAIDDGSGGQGLGTPQNPEGWMNDPSQYNEDPTALAAHTVHFAYDSSVIKSDESANVEAAANYVKNDANVGLRIDGHCDERGTEGYNDALGERRAAALRDAVIALGADRNRVITQSWGERKPAAQGQDESAYAQNRRGEFIVLRKK
jgi:peptidoglycan-associated lipoprotein